MWPDIQRMCPLGSRLTRPRHGIFAHCAYFVCAMVKFFRVEQNSVPLFFKNFLRTRMSHDLDFFNSMTRLCSTIFDCYQ